MNRRLLIILMCALIIAAGATYGVYKLVRQQVAGANRPQVTKVVVANKNLDIGAIVKETDLKAGDWSGALPKGIAIDPKAVIGRGVVSAVIEGEPLMDSRLAPVGSGGGLAATIPPGMRACAVRVNEVVGVAGFVVPGMRVDVLISGNPPSATGAAVPAGTRVKTLLQNIEVLSAGTNIQKDAEGKPVNVQVVNLLVTPEQAETLSLASNETRIQLVLRNPLDTQTAKTPGSAVSALFSDTNVPPATAPKPAAPRAPVKRVAAAPVKEEKPLAPGIYTIEVINGANRSQAKFEKPQQEQP